MTNLIDQFDQKTNQIKEPIPQPPLIEFVSCFGCVSKSLALLWNCAGTSVTWVSTHAAWPFFQPTKPVFVHTHWWEDSFPASLLRETRCHVMSRKQQTSFPNRVSDIRGSVSNRTFLFWGQQSPRWNVIKPWHNEDASSIKSQWERIIQLGWIRSVICPMPKS